MSATLPGRLLTEVTCPNCWLRFSPEKVLFVARHDALLGDSVVGSDAFRRFLPMRFTIEGDALDSHGQVCTQLACPRCHLELPRAHIEMPPLFFSIVGVPASGKSYFLAAMSHGCTKINSSTTPTWTGRSNFPRLSRRTRRLSGPWLSMGKRKPFPGRSSFR